MKYAKLYELRDKTDRQLLALIGRRLDAGIQYARRELYRQAEKAHREARTLLQVANGMSSAEQRDLELKLVRLGALLEESSAGLLVRTAGG